MHWKVRVLMPGLVWMGLVAAGAAQVSDAPLEVQMLSSPAPEGEVIHWRARNISSKDVIAYVACAPRSDGGCQRVHMAVLGMAFSPPSRLRPGEVLEDRPSLGLAAKPRLATVDYVLFADGSSWGPDSKKQSLQIRGLLQGRRATIAELKRIMETQGVQAVEAILKGEAP